MRPEDFGESGKLVINHARQIAALLDSSVVGTAHLFLGVAALDDDVIGRRFRAASADLHAIAARVRGQLAADGPAGELLFDATLTALEEAARAASTQASALVEAPHILIGVLRDRGGLVARALTEAGADVEQLDEQLWKMLAEGDWSADAYQQRRAIQQPGTGTPSEVLESLGRDLTAAARAGELSPIIGRADELRELHTILCGMRKNNAVLIGDAGVGKTAVVEGLAQQVVAGEVPEQLEGMTIRTIEVGSLLAGTMYRGQFEKKLKELVDAARARDDLILFIDEFHTLIGAGRAEGVSADAADYLKPALTEGKLKVIGATTTEEFRRDVEQDKALMRRFLQVIGDEPSRDDALRILEGLRPRYAEFHGVTIEDGALAACIDLSVRHMHDRYLPDKALDLLDRACTRQKLAARIGESSVGEENVAEVVSVMLEIPVGRLRPDEGKRLSRMGEAIKRRVIGQDEAVDAVAKTIIGAHTIKDPKRPYGVFLLLGPTGVGKTRLAGEVARYLFGAGDEPIRLDMSEYSEAHTVSGLIGASPPYQGWEAGGRLTNAVRTKPYTVLLLDEFEKAHDDVAKLFLQVFDAGHLSDRAGRKVDFRNTVIFMTSNVGARQVLESRPIGFGAADAAQPSYEEVRRAVQRELEREFAPELVNRIDHVLVFRPVSRESLRAIIGLLLEEMIPLRLEWSEAALDRLVEESHDPAMGARPARRAIQRLVRNPLSLMLANGELDEHDEVAVTASEGALRFARRT